MNPLFGPRKQTRFDIETTDARLVSDVVLTADQERIKRVVDAFLYKEMILNTGLVYNSGVVRDHYGTLSSDYIWNFAVMDKELVCFFSKNTDVGGKSIIYRSKFYQDDLEQADIRFWDNLYSEEKSRKILLWSIARFLATECMSDNHWSSVKPVPDKLAIAQKIESLASYSYSVDNDNDELLTKAIEILGM